jgi:membrane protease YdiL (CAAX protease family)
MVFFGLNLSPGHLLPSVVLFTLVTLLLSPLMTLMRDQGRSIWPPVIFHACFNAAVPVALSLWNAPDFPWGKVALVSVPALGALLVALLHRRPDRELAQAA